MTVGERLKIARERARLTLREVAARTDIGESSLSEFENAKREPRLAQLDTLARLYNRSVSFFFEPEAVAPETVLWRERPHAPDANRIEGHFLRLCGQYHHLETWLNDKRAEIIPDAEGDSTTYDFKDAERLAHKVHSELGLGDRPGQSLLVVLEEVCGLKVFHLEFEPTGTAACTRTADFGCAILLNSNNARWRRNFDLAHELFHLLTWRIFRREGQTDHPEADSKEEKLANVFASNLLMPTDVAMDAINEKIKESSISFEDMFDIARQFDVSADALYWRMVSLRFLSRENAGDNIKPFREWALSREGQRTNDRPPTLPERYCVLATRALRQGEMSIGRFAEYMEVGRREAARVLEQEAQPDEKVQVTAP